MNLIFLNLLSKLSGFMREIIFLNIFGTGKEMDAFIFAMSIPVFLYQVFGEAIKISFIPNFHKQKNKVEYTNLIIKAIFLLSIVLSILLLFFSNKIVVLLAPGLDHETYLLSIKMLNQLSFLLVGYSISSIFIAYLSAEKDYKTPLMVSLIFNSIILITTFLLKKQLKIYSAVLGVQLGILFQCIFLYYKSKKIQFKFLKKTKKNLKDLKLIFYTSVPIMIGNSTLQVNNLIDKMLGSYLGDGSITIINFANKINTLVFSIFILTFSMVIYNKFILISQKDKLEKQVDIYLNNILYFFLPLSFLLNLNAKNISRLIFFNKLSENNLIRMEGLLKLYFLSLVFLAIKEIYIKLFYSKGKAKVPNIISVISVGINIIGTIVLSKLIGLNGVALASLISVVFSVTVMSFVLRKNNIYSLKRVINNKIAIVILLNIIIYYLMLKNQFQIWYLNLIFSIMIYFLSNILLNFKYLIKITKDKKLGSILKF